MTKHVGVDWARGCWVTVAVTEYGRLDIATEPAFLNVWHEHRDADALLVDIPIGIDDTPRECDEAARRFLLNRHSTVFPVPHREAVEARTYDEAREHTNGSLGSQSWGMVPRIREVDVFLQHYPEARPHLYESHPEVCYSRFADRYGRERPASKRSKQGSADRLSILESVDEKLGERIREFVDARSDEAEWHHRIQSGRTDDVLDAAVLALTGLDADGSFSVFPSAKSVDDDSVIVYPP